MRRGNRWWLIGAITAVIAFIAGVVVAVQLSGRDTPDCTAVRAMIDYNKEFEVSVQESADAADPSGSSMPRFQSWAAQLKQYADRITDERLAADADRLAALADESLGVVEEMRADETFSTRQDTPEYVLDYSSIGEQFQDSLVKLDQACPA